MRKFSSFLISTLMLSIVFWWLFPQVLSCLLIKNNDDFIEIQPNVFVSRGTSPTEITLLKKNIILAQNRIKQFWQQKNGYAVIIFCNNDTHYAKLCQTTEGSGCSVGTPFGTWIILNYDGLNIDVIAHEMCHDELQTKLGWWNTQQQIPTWFDEGLALQLDDRFVASHDSIQRYIDYKTELQLVNPAPISLDDLATNNSFFGKDRHKTKIAYLIAATEVSRKVSKGGRQKIRAIIEQIKHGDSFNTAYFNVARL